MATQSYRKVNPMAAALVATMADDPKRKEIEDDDFIERILIPLGLVSPMFGYYGTRHKKSVEEEE